MRHIFLLAVPAAAATLLFAQATRPPSGGSKAPSSGEFVSSFLGRVGAVTPQANDYSFSQIGSTLDPAKIASGGATTGQILIWNGTHYVPGDLVYVDQATPTGTVDGSNAAFTIPYTPLSGSLYVWRNGMLQRVGGDYTVSAQTITFFSGSVPRTGDTLLVSYRR